ncbi:hypothetical protein C3Y91_31170 [Rhizobium sp. UPM1133]|nr:hypothetical protein [Rhizobium ruizarguesonis]
MGSITLANQTGDDGSSWPTSIRKGPPSAVGARKSTWYSSSPTQQRWRGAPSNDIGIKIKQAREVPRLL